MAYNQYADLVTSDDDYICFVDRDVMFLTADYGQIIEETIAKNRHVGLFTCLTNRVGNLRQCLNGEISESSDMISHYKIAEERKNSFRTDVLFTDHVISGHFMVIQKAIWKRIGGAKDGLLGVDNHISRIILREGLPIAIMQGLYVFHYYRMHSGRHDKSHLL